MNKWTHSGSLKNEPSQYEKKHRAFARRAATEGIVLLKNDGVLPLKLSDPIALFGNGAERTVKGGIGSEIMTDVTERPEKRGGKRFWKMHIMYKIRLMPMRQIPLFFRMDL